MTDEELTRTLTAHEHEIGSLKHRMKDVEDIVNVVHQLASEMVALTKEIQHMNKTIEQLNTEVNELKNKPAQRWELVVTTIISALAGVFISTLF
mgnify:CR=1 FL=1